MTPVRPIFLTELFPNLDARLVELLRGLSEEDWRRPTACSAWDVGDIAAHLLDGNLRRLSSGRDSGGELASEPQILGHDDLVALVNQLNAEWITAARRLSPRVIVDLLEGTSHQVYEYFGTLDPFGDAVFAVTWAGETTSLNWFDVAREFTERWHHQQQIRDAVGAPPLTDRLYLFPVLDTFMRGLPHSYRDVDAWDGAAVVVRVLGLSGGEWTLVAEHGNWSLYEGGVDGSAASIQLDQDDAWRLFTKGLTAQEVRSRATVKGNSALLDPVFAMVAVVG